MAEKEEWEIISGIDYVPVCRHCHEILDVMPNAIRFIHREPGHIYVKPGEFGIYPYSCKKCGAIFTDIRMPKSIQIKKEEIH